jgi:hypothetical protein
MFVFMNCEKTPCPGRLLAQVLPVYSYKQAGTQFFVGNPGYSWSPYTHSGILLFIGNAAGKENLF